MKQGEKGIITQEALGTHYHEIAEKVPVRCSKPFFDNTNVYQSLLHGK